MLIKLRKYEEKSSLAYFVKTIPISKQKAQKMVILSTVAKMITAALERKGQLRAHFQSVYIIF